MIAQTINKEIQNEIISRNINWFNRVGLAWRTLLHSGNRVVNMNLAQEWDIVRATKGVSFVSVAKKLNCNRKTLYSMLNSSNPTISTLDKLAAGFGVDYLDVIKSARDRVNETN